MAELKVQSLERTFDILEILAREPGGLGLSEIAQRASLPRSTAFRLLAVLSGREYVRKTADSARYRLGPGLIELGSIYLNSLELKTESAPAMRELAEAFGTIVFMACRQGSKAVYIDRYDQYHSLRKYAIIGQQRPLYCTALGKALLLDFQDQELFSLFEGQVFEAVGPNTHPDVEHLAEDLRTCRDRGWTFDNEENEAGTLCVAAPVRDYRGSIISSLSTSWSRELRPELEPAKVAQRVLNAASIISRNMGWAERRTASV
ncbi:MAG TPA: IclR family transcriptional regulator [Rectinemataceae bacterium]